MPIPDLLFIARNPFPEGSGEEMKKVLLLLLGCAVQSPDKKQEFIERIQQLESSLQHALMQEISKIIGSTEYVLSVQALELEPGQESTATVLHQLQRVVKERDTYASAMVELGGEQESDSGSGASLGGCCNGDVCARKLPECQQHDVRPGSPISSDRNHLMLELANVQAKLRRARSERDEATELVEELRCEVTGKERECDQMHKEKVELMREAAKAKQYRDELDEWKIKGCQADRLEKENDKLREKLSDLEFYRSRVEELKRDNHLLQETGQVKESQIQKWKDLAHRRDSEDRKLVEAERQILELQEKLKSEMSKVEEVVQESSRLENDYQTSVQKCTSLEKELLHVKQPNTPRLDTGSLEEQLAGSVQSQLLLLQLENEKLKAQVDSAKSATANEEGRQQNKQMQDEIDTLKQQKMELEDHLEDMDKRLTELNEDKEDQLNEVSSERDSIRDECDQLRQRFQLLQCEAQQLATDEEQRKLEHFRCEMDASKTRNESLSKDNKRFAQELSRVKLELKQAENKLLEFEEQGLNSEHRLHAMERENRCLQKEKGTLKIKLEASDVEIETCRSKLVELEQNQRRMEEQRCRLEEARSRLVELETEKMQACTQSELDSKRACRLAHDLIHEKTTNSQLNARINTLCQIVGVNPEQELEKTKDGDTAQVDMDRLVLDKWTSVQTEVEKCKMRVSTAEGQTEELRMCLQRTEKELDTVRKQIKDNNDSALSASTDFDSSRLKELETENSDVKEQVSILQEKIRKLQAQLLLKENNYNQLNKEHVDLKMKMACLSSLQSEKAELEGCIRNAQLQEELLRQDNEEMQKQCIDMNKQQQATTIDYQALQRLHNDLLCDHEQLQSLHEQLNREYECIKGEVNELRRKYRDQRSCDGEMSSIKGQADKDRKLAAEMKALISEEREKRERDLRGYALLQNEHTDMKKRLDESRCKFEVLRQDFNDQQNVVRRLKSDLHTTQTTCSRYETSVQELQKELGLKDLDCTRSQARCDMLEELNTARGEENQQVLRQLDMLISQNQDLLNQLLMDQEKYHGKETDWQEKLNAMRRQKEKLEEKIMDQYKTIPNKRKDKDTFVRRAAKMLRAPSRRRVSSKEGRVSSEDTSSAFSADEATTVPPATDNNAALLPCPDNNRAFCASTASSSTSSGSGASAGSGPEAHDRTGHRFSNGEVGAVVVVMDSKRQKRQCDNIRISWAGSERAVDVPCNSSSSSRLQPCMGTAVQRGGSGAVCSPTRPPVPPPRMGVGNVARPPPPPYPAKPPPTRSQNRDSAKQSTNSLRPPPPPYPGSPSVSLRSQKHSPSSCSSPSNLCRFRPDLAAESKENYTPADEHSLLQQTSLFAPPQTSTPKMDRRSMPIGPYQPPSASHFDEAKGENDNHSIVAAEIPGGTVFLRKSNSAQLLQQARAISLYENIEELEKYSNANVSNYDNDEKDSIADELERNDINESEDKDKKGTIWYEYGCL